MSFIEVREYAEPTPDGEEICGALRWYVNGWMPIFPVTNRIGVKTEDAAAIPFTLTRYELKARWLDNSILSVGLEEK